MCQDTNLAYLIVAKNQLFNNGRIRKDLTVEVPDPIVAQIDLLEPRKPMEGCSLHQRQPIVRQRHFLQAYNVQEASVAQLLNLIVAHVQFLDRLDNLDCLPNHVSIPDVIVRQHKLLHLLHIAEGSRVNPRDLVPSEVCENQVGEVLEDAHLKPLQP